MTKLLEFRKKYPQYDNLDDNKLSEALYNKHYSDRVSLDEFNTLFRGKEAGWGETIGKSVQNAGLSFPKITAGLAEHGMDNIVQDRQFRDNPNIATEGLAAYNKVNEAQTIWQGVVDSKPDSVTNEEFDKAHYYDENLRERSTFEKVKNAVYPDVMQGLSAAVDLITDDIPTENLERARDSVQHVRKDYEKTIAENRPKIHDPESMKQIAGEAIEGSASMVAAIGTYALTKNAGLASAAIFPYAKSGSYTESKDKGLSLSESNQRSNVLAGAEMLTEKLPLDVLLSKGKSHVMKIMKAGIFEGVEEAAIEAITYLYDRGVLDDKTPLEELPARMWHSFKVGAFMGSGLKGTGVAIERTQGYMQARAEMKQGETDASDAQIDKFTGNDITDPSKEFNLLENGIEAPKSEGEILAQFMADQEYNQEFDRMVEEPQAVDVEETEQLGMDEAPQEPLPLEQPVIEQAPEQPQVDIEQLTTSAFEVNEEATNAFFDELESGRVSEDQLAPTLQGIIDGGTPVVEQPPVEEVVEEQPVTDLPTESVDKAVDEVEKVDPRNDLPPTSEDPRYDAVEQTHIALAGKTAAGGLKGGNPLAEQAREVANNIKTKMMIGESFEDSLKAEKKRDGIGADVFIDSLEQVEKQLANREKLKAKTKPVDPKAEYEEQREQDVQKIAKAVRFIKQKVENGKTYYGEGNMAKAMLGQAKRLGVEESTALSILGFTPSGSAIPVKDRNSKAAFVRGLDNYFDYFDRNPEHKTSSDLPDKYHAIASMHPNEYRPLAERLQKESKALGDAKIKAELAERDKKQAIKDKKIAKYKTAIGNAKTITQVQSIIDSGDQPLNVLKEAIHAFAKNNGLSDLSFSADISRAKHDFQVISRLQDEIDNNAKPSKGEDVEPIYVDAGTKSNPRKVTDGDGFFIGGEAVELTRVIGDSVEFANTQFDYNGKITIDELLDEGYVYEYKAPVPKADITTDKTTDPIVEVNKKIKALTIKGEDALRKNAKATTTKGRQAANVAHGKAMDELNTQEVLKKKLLAEKKPKPKAETKLDSAEASIDKQIDKAADELADLFKNMKGRANSGIDPQIAIAGSKLAALYIAKGSIKFARFANDILAKMREFGISESDVKPYLKKWYLQAQDDVTDEQLEQMDDVITVRTTDVDNLLDEADETFTDELGNEFVTDDLIGGELDETESNFDELMTTPISDVTAKEFKAAAVAEIESKGDAYVTEKLKNYMEVHGLGMFSARRYLSFEQGFWNAYDYVEVVEHAISAKNGVAGDFTDFSLLLNSFQKNQQVTKEQRALLKNLATPYYNENVGYVQNSVITDDNGNAAHDASRDYRHHDVLDGDLTVKVWVDNIIDKKGTVYSVNEIANWAHGQAIGTTDIADQKEQPHNVLTPAIHDDINTPFVKSLFKMPLKAIGIANTAKNRLEFINVLNGLVNLGYSTKQREFAADIDLTPSKFNTDLMVMWVATLGSVSGNRPQQVTSWFRHIFNNGRSVRLHLDDVAHKSGQFYAQNTKYSGGQTGQDKSLIDQFNVLAENYDKIKEALKLPALPKKEKANVPATSDNVEQDSKSSDNQTAEPKTANDDGSTDTGRVSSESNEQDGKQVQSASDESVSNNADPVSRTDGSNGLLQPDGSTKLDENASDTSEPRRSDSDNDNGSEARPDGKSATNNVVEQLGLDKPVAPPSSVSGHKWANLESIKQSAPALQPEQAQDIVNIEKRFFEDKGHGFLATNGTGTGKTFVGLGTIARFKQAGMKNVLILVPSDGIANEWASTDKKYFDLGVYKIGADGSLKTKDKGQAITVVTYASFAQNKALILDRDKWDLIVADESQKLMSGANAKETESLNRLRIATNHEQANYSGAKLKYEDEQNELNDEIKSKAEKLVASYGNAGQFIDDERALKETRELYKRDQQEIDSKVQAESKVRKEKGQLDTKVLFLSATPFPYVKTLDYAEGYLFNYSEYGEKYEGGYENSGHGHNSFFIQNFGYRWRYHKLNQPSGDVDTGIMERQFYESMKKSGRINGRALEVPFDFGRDYYITPTAAGQKLDELIDHWNTYKVIGLDEKGEEVINDGKPTMVKPYEDLAQIIRKEFNYIKQIKLIEAIKAEPVAKRVQEYVAQGKQAVIFHSYNVGGSENPIHLVERANPELFARYAKKFPKMVDIEFGELKRPLDVFQEAFGDKVGFYNGGVSNKERARLKKDFQNDDSDLRVLVVQVDAGEAGLSLHDLSGKHPRILTNIGVPAKPTQFTQVEGRIYRVGVLSEPHFEYPTSGTAFEDRLWSDRIAGRASTAENLAMGDEARRLKDSIVDGYTGAEIVNGLSESFGKGGKEKDKTVETSDWDRAKSYYWANEKRTQATKAKEGNDYFATPEPLGMKMIEWLQTNKGDRLLEPSIGHGAIGRWFPENTINKAVERSTILSPRAQMIFKGKVITSDFEDFSILNKFEGIVMNPPFGKGGKLAYEHITKAIRHLTNGGRILAIVPDGGLAEKRLKDMMGDDKHKNIYLSAVVDLPSGAFSRAGTGVKTKILVLDRFDNSEDAPDGTHRVELKGKDPSELFEKIEHLELPERLEATEKVIDPTQYMDTERKMIKSRKGAELYPVKLYTELPYKLEKMFADLAKDFEGYATKADPNAFMFGDVEAKEDFVTQAAKTINDLLESGIELTFTIPMAKVKVEGEAKNEYFELLDETYSTKSGANAGKENIQVDMLQRLDRSEYFAFVKWAKDDMNGWYHKRIGHFMFDSVEDAKRFIELGAKKLKGEPLVSDAQMDEARKEFKNQIGRANSGLDPKLLKAAMILTAGKVERGAKTFMKYARAMRKYLGNIPTRFLNTWFNKHKKENTLTTVRKVIGDKIIKPIAKAVPYGVLQVDQIIRQQRHLFSNGMESLLDTFAKSIQDMQAFRNKILSDAEKRIDEAWDKLDGETSDRLSQVMLDATMTRTDPAILLEKQPKFADITEKLATRKAKLEEIETTIARTGNITDLQEQAMKNLARSITYYRKQLAEQRAVFSKVSENYNKLNKDGKDMYKAVRQFYIDLWAKQKDALVERIKALELDGRQRKIALDTIENTYTRASSQGVYFPLSRFGEYIVKVKSKESGRVTERYQFESEAEAEAVLAKLTTQHSKNPDLEVKKDFLTPTKHKKTNTTEFAKDLINKIKKLSEENDAELQDDDLMNPNSPVKDITEIFGMISDVEVMDLIYQSMLRSLPHNSSGKNLIHRSYIKGASTDQRRAFSQSVFQSAVTISKIKYAHVTSKALTDMDKMVDGDKYPQENIVEARKLAKHMNDVHDANMNPDGWAISSKLITGAFLYHLSASPAAGLVNMSQTFLVGIPILGSRYGVNNTVQEISRLSGKYAQQAWKTKKGFNLKKAAQADAWVSLKDSDAVTAEQRELLIQLHNEGDIELTQAHAMSQMAETDMRNKAIVNRGVIKGIRAVSSIFHNAEIFNREIIAVATMNLYAKDYKKKHGKAPTKEMVKEAARRAIKKIHFDYSTENRSLLFRKLKLMFVFKTYSQNITNIMLTDIKEAFVHADPKERRAHAKSFIYMMTGHVLAGGYLALPLAKEMFWFVSSIVEMLSGDDEEVDLLAEARTELHKISPILEDVAFRGLLNTLGWDWSNRIKLDGLFYRSSDKDMSDKDQIFHYIQEILGAILGTGVKIGRGIMTMKQGSKENDDHKFVKGLAAALPKSLADPTKAFYRTLHGERDYKGNELMPQSDFTEGVAPVWRTVVQTMGFSPSALTDIYDLNNAKKNTVGKVDVKRKLLMTRFYNLQEKNISTDGVINDIEAFNDMFPEKAILNEQLVKGLKARAYRTDRTEQGTYLTDKDREQADKINF